MADQTPFLKTEVPADAAARFAKIRQELLQLPGARRGQYVFSAADIRSYELWVLRERESTYVKNKADEGPRYKRFLSCLQGEVTGGWGTDEKRENLATMLHDRILETFDPFAGEKKTVTRGKAVLKSRLRAQAKCLQYFSLLIRRGNQAALWMWCPPAVPLILEREATPFQRASLADYQQVLNARQFLEQALQQRAALQHSIVLNQDYREGEILLSALLFGGLGELAALKSVLQQLRKRQKLTVFDSIGLAFWDLPIPMFRGGVRLRRWFPDPFSEILMMRYLQEHPASESEAGTAEKADATFSAQDIRGRMTMVLRSWPRVGRRHIQPASLFKGVTQALRLELPQFLGAYAEGLLEAHALARSSWWRIHGYPVPAETSPQPDVESAEKKPLESAPGVIESTVTVAWLHQLRHILRAKNRGDALKALDTFLSQTDLTDPLGQRMFLWARHLLKKGSSFHHHLAMTTIGRYVSRLAALMLQVLEDTQVIDSFGEPSWRQLYEDLLEQVDTAHQRAHLIRAIREWHQFLVETQGAAALSLQDLGGFQMDVIPDAHGISESEFHQLKTALQEGRHALHHQQLPDLLTLVVILGYRCGLRRMEVLRLRISDCHLEGQARLLIRPFSERRLKTRHATRALPLHVLLEDGELALLRQWVAYRGESGAVSGEDYLFVLPEIGHNPIAQETAMSRIHEDLRWVTGDAQLHFHHLRHSFANQLLWKLMLADMDPQYLPEPYRKEQASARRFRQALLGVDHVNRKQLYAVAALLGHSSPEISLNHYLHNLDLILGLSVRAQVAQARNVQNWLKALKGRLNEKTLYRAYAREGVDGLLSRLRKNIPEAMHTPVHDAERDALIARSSSSEAERQKGRERSERFIERLWFLLLRGFTQSTAIPSPHQADQESFWSAIAEDADVSAQQLARMAGKVQSLFALKSRMGPRHKALQISQFGTGKRDVPLPSRPSTRMDKEHLIKMLPGFWRMADKDPEWLRTTLDVYLERAWRSEPGHFLLRSPTDTGEVALANAFKQLLLGLEISPRNIRYLSFDAEKRRSRWRALWRKALQLNTRDVIGEKTIPNNQHGMESAWLQIHPVFEQVGKRPDGMSPAFSYLMVMGAVVLAGVITL
ncbi:tyrosine-type recombinase/integrase [Acidithiobacillus montserratensis]|uniref:Tyrosine-type recombinase/integrase n=1 Tax=Acidithiobacillus montserratensis TaxID=2729135 RepID=A0ACD5HHK8_9PROT|nr:tyrosine-type recombinase/integrase [Acidithiobacillus montserratensis]MBU2747113.1 tyrosine-type recombinase/integrase [Acidithiobacillus montserratensis]